MEKELERRIQELEEIIESKWETFEMRDAIEDKLKRLKTLYNDLTKFY